MTIAHSKRKDLSSAYMSRQRCAAGWPLPATLVYARPELLRAAWGCTEFCLHALLASLGCTSILSHAVCNLVPSAEGADSRPAALASHIELRSSGLASVIVRTAAECTCASLTVCALLLQPKRMPALCVCVCVCVCVGGVVFYLNCLEVLEQISLLEVSPAHQHMHVATLVQTVLDLATLEVLDSLQ